MKTTYHSNLGISDSSQVGNASSKEEKCFKIFFMYPHIGFSPTNWFVETFEVCEGETWSLGLQGAELWARCFGPSHSLAPCVFWGQLISSVCHKPGRELAPCCSWDTQASSHVLPLEARVSALKNSEGTNMASDWHAGHHCRLSSLSGSTELFYSIIYPDTVMKKYIFQTFALIPGYWVLSILFVLLQGRY